MRDVDLEIRTYERERDAAAIARTWRELGWIEPEAKAEEALGWFLDAGEAEVGVVDGEAEALAHRTPGTIRYQDVDLPLCAVTAVTTSHLARKRGLATTLTARALAAGHASGAAVAALGQFEQGFYDRLGFGSAAYVHLGSLRASLAEGASIQEILDDFPTLTEQAVRAVIAFAATSAEEDLPFPSIPHIA